MNTFLVPGQVTAKPAAVAIAFKDGLALLTADPVMIADSFIVVAKHIDEKMVNCPLFFCGLLPSSSPIC
jgi:hypothetical protein